MRHKQRRNSGPTMGKWIAIGAGVGIVLGGASDNPGSGLVFGAAIGIAVGLALSRRKNSSNGKDDA